MTTQQSAALLALADELAKAGRANWTHPKRAEFADRLRALASPAPTEGGVLWQAIDDALEDMELNGMHGEHSYKALKQMHREALATTPAAAINSSSIYSKFIVAEQTPAAGGDERAAWRDLVLRAWQILDVECPNDPLTDELLAALNNTAIEQSRVQDSGAAIRTVDLEWIIRQLDAPEKAAHGARRGIPAIKFVAERFLLTLRTTPHSPCTQESGAVAVVGPGGYPNWLVSWLESPGYKTLPSGTKLYTQEPSAQGEKK